MYLLLSSGRCMVRLLESLLAFNTTIIHLLYHNFMDSERQNIKNNIDEICVKNLLKNFFFINPCNPKIIRQGMREYFFQQKFYVEGNKRRKLFSYIIHCFFPANFPCLSIFICPSIPSFSSFYTSHKHIKVYFFKFFLSKITNFLRI